MSQGEFETVYTEKHEVHCDGSGAGLGHPRVFLHINSETGGVQCPYCSKYYVYKPDANRYASLR